MKIKSIKKIVRWVRLMRAKYDAFRFVKKHGPEVFAYCIKHKLFDPEVQKAVIAEAGAIHSGKSRLTHSGRARIMKMIRKMETVGLITKNGTKPQFPRK